MRQVSLKPALVDGWGTWGAWSIPFFLFYEVGYILVDEKLYRRPKFQFSKYVRINIIYYSAYTLLLMLHHWTLQVPEKLN